ncbi:hypothetical protein FRC12_019655, partial [Ceratobasidium sp. 428]
MSGKRPCKFFNTPAGCRNRKCQYAHVKTNGSSGRGPQPLANAHTKNKQAMPAGLPRNACRDFWTSGNCSRGFACTYDHIKGSGQANRTEDESPASHLQTEIDAHSDPETEKSPGEVH